MLNFILAIMICRWQIIEFHKNVFILEEIKGESQNLMVIRRVLRQSFSWNTTNVLVKETLALVCVTSDFRAF